MTEPSEPRPETRSIRQRLPGVVEHYGLVGAFAIVIVLFSALSPKFATFANFASILGSQAVLVLLTLALLIPLRAGDTDLSCAAVCSLAGMVVAVLNVREGVPIEIAIAAALIACAFVGLVNGVLAIYFGIDTFIITIGTQTFLSGMILLLSNNQTIAGVSEGLVEAVFGFRPFGIPMAFFYGLAACILLWYVFEHTSLGVRILFVGRNRNVAALSGIRVPLVRIGCLVGCSLLSGISGIVYAGSTGSADPASAFTFLLPAFAGCFLGATTIIPGQFNAVGSFIAVYFLVTGITGLAILGASAWVQPAFYGGALVISVVLSRLTRRRVEQQLLYLA